MFPIINPRGQIVGFGGRILNSDGKGPKYLNSPETVIFSKSYELYNLNDAKKNLTDGRIYLVEGYMDVVSLYEKGIKNAVAALGTAFTPYHGKILSRYVKEVVLLFDGDQAGQAATEKALNILKSTDISVTIIVLANDEDPDSFIQEYELKLLKRQFDLTTTDGKIAYGTAAIKILKDCQTAVEVEFYSQQVADETGINKKVIHSEIVRARSGKESGQILKEIKPSQANEQIPKAYQVAQELAVRYCLENRQAIDELLPEALTIHEYAQFIELLKEKPQAKATEILTTFNESAAVKALSGLIMTEETVSRDDFEDALKIIRRFYNENCLEKLTQEIQIATQNGEDEQVAELMDQLIKLKKDNGRR
jgi:DNA primase